MKRSPGNSLLKLETWNLKLFVVSVLLSTFLFGQEANTGSEDNAKSLLRVARRHSEAWRSEFLETFLGRNHATTHPELSRTLSEVLSAPTESKLSPILSSHGGEAGELSNVLGLAARESRTWKPGAPLTSETLAALTERFYRGPPAGGRTHRLESSPVPEGLRAWLFEEQKVNDRFSMNVRITSWGDTLAKELDPKNSPVYWLRHLEIPVEEMRVFQAVNVAPETSSRLLFQRDGKTYVRYFLHPGSLESPSIQKLIQKLFVR